MKLLNIIKNKTGKNNSNVNINNKNLNNNNNKNLNNNINNTIKKNNENIGNLNKNNSNTNIDNKNKRKYSIEDFKNNENNEISLVSEKIENYYEISPPNNKKPNLNKMNLNTKEKQCLEKITKIKNEDKLLHNNFSKTRPFNSKMKNFNYLKLYKTAQEKYLEMETLKNLENKQNSILKLKQEKKLPSKFEKSKNM